MSRPIAEIKADALELLAVSERSVSEMQSVLGVEASHLSQQLAVLRRAGLVSTRKVGASVLYSIRDPQLIELLAVAKRMLIRSLSQSEDLLAGLRASSV